MALLQMKLIRGLFGAPRRRERASRSDSSTNADRAIFAALPDVAAESTNKRNGRAPLGLARIAVLGALVALAAGGSAFAFQALPPGTQVNDDRAAGIDKTISISGHDAGNADVVGGALVAGKPGVPRHRLTIRSSRGRSRAAPGQREVTERSAVAPAPPRRSAVRSTSTRTRTARLLRSISLAPDARSPGLPGMRTRPARASRTTTSSPPASTTRAGPIRASGSSPARPAARGKAPYRFPR
jgi:hypothetical protein